MVSHFKDPCSCFYFFAQCHLKMCNNLSGSFILFLCIFCQKIHEFSSFPSTKHSRPTEMTNLALRYLSNAAWVKSRKVTVFVQNPSVHNPSTIFFPSTFEIPKSAKFWVKIFILNQCKSSGSKFLRSSSINYQVLSHLNSSHFADFCAWYVWFSWDTRAWRKLTCAEVKGCVA